MAGATHAVILNARSGPSACSPAALAPVLAGQGLMAEIHCPERPAEIPELTRGLLSRGVTTVVAAGGDGTVSAVASVLTGEQRATMGILPLGTFNHLARDLRIPLELEGAVRLIADAARGEAGTTLIDTATVNERFFLNNISLGVYPAFVSLRGDTRRYAKPVRWLLNARAMARAFHHLPRLFVHIEVDERSMRRVTPLVFAGNNTYRIDEPDAGTRASLADGHLSLIVARPKGPWGLARLAVRAAFGTLRGARDLEEFTAGRIVIHSPRSILPVGVDGEVLRMATPLRCAIHPRSLRVIVPGPPLQPDSHRL